MSLSGQGEVARAQAFGVTGEVSLLPARLSRFPVYSGAHGARMSNEPSPDEYLIP